MKEMSRRNQYFTDSVIRRMTRIAIANNAINLAQGFPDFDPPKAMTDRLAEVSATGPHQYPITMGAPNFRRALANKCGRFMGRTLDPETDIKRLHANPPINHVIFPWREKYGLSPGIR